jgi:hypothetical protein
MSKPLHFTLHAETVISERQLDRAWTKRRLYLRDQPDARWQAIKINLAKA